VSWEAVTRWVLRCDGRITHDHQCPEVYLAFDEDGEVLPDPYAWSETDRGTAAEWLRYSRWMVAPDGRMLCPRHVEAGERMAAAALEGLPFDELRD
jgi:hypothetical protein